MFSWLKNMFPQRHEHDWARLGESWPGQDVIVCVTCGICEANDWSSTQRFSYQSLKAANYARGDWKSKFDAIEAKFPALAGKSA
jgi:hypothetical protein